MQKPISLLLSGVFVRRLRLVVFVLMLASVSRAEPYWQKAGVLLREGNYAAAYAETQALLKDHPNDGVLLRIEGVCLLETGRPREAVVALRRALADPGSVASRYYLAQALAFQGDLTEAVRILGEVIAMAPASEYARLARGVLPELTATAATTTAVPKTQRWNIYVRAAGEHDDNVPLRAGGDPNQDATASWRQVYSAYAELRPLDEACQKTPFTLGLGYSFYTTRHAEEALKGYDVLSHNGSVFISRHRQLGAKPYTVRIHGDFTDTELGDDPYSQVIEAGLDVDYQWIRHAVVSPKFVWQSRDFENDTEYPEYFSRDGEDYRAGLGHDLYLAEGKAVLGVSYFYHKNATDGRQFRIKSNDVTGSLKLSLPLAVRFFGSVGYRQEDYTEFTPEPKRLDDIWTYYASLSRRIVKDAVRAEVNYTHETGESNLEFSDYERNVVGFALSISL